MMKFFIYLSILSAIFLTACETADDDRIPAYAVAINLTGAGIWNSYGVSGFGTHRNFIYNSSTREPRAFPYTATSATGFGGVLLINGVDVFTTESDVPLAYDLSCPVEAKADIRVGIDAETYDAVCPKCGSHYDVVTGGGGPLSGPAAQRDHKYALRRYRCLPSTDGGYLITN